MCLPQVSSIKKKISPKTFGPHCVLFTYSLLPVSYYVVFPSFPFNPIASSVVFDAIIVFFMSSDLSVMSIIWLHLQVRIRSITFKLTLPLFRPMIPNQGSIEHVQGFHRNCVINKYIQSLKYYKKFQTSVCQRRTASRFKFNICAKRGKSVTLKVNLILIIDVRFILMFK